MRPNWIERLFRINTSKTEKKCRHKWEYTNKKSTSQEKAYNHYVENKSMIVLNKNKEVILFDVFKAMCTERCYWFEFADKYCIHCFEKKRVLLRHIMDFDV